MTESCEYCEEEFEKEREKLSHELSEHEEEMSGHDQDSKETRLNKIKEKDKAKRAEKKSKALKYGGAVALLLVISAGGIYAYQSGLLESERNTNPEIGVGEPVHWHADYQIEVCGENQILSGGPLTAHTHGEQTFHLEGVRETREEATLEWIVNQLDGNFSSTGILGYEEPESCPGSDEPGTLTVTANGETLEEPEDYIVRDGDFIVIRYE